MAFLDAKSRKSFFAGLAAAKKAAGGIPSGLPKAFTASPSLELPKVPEPQLPEPEKLPTIKSLMKTAKARKVK